ncbi:AMP-binding protein [Shimazuella sp. AN120528]|uniref:AMP-binding protein n=1 Tax=Shimazuella soli TaxID=1892854 RepID=UPI001F0F47FD|nr:AMP-binding protein [Shimazuella soli]MCH5583430.1 AMP-binding protein [Shimazuella soli]
MKQSVWIPKQEQIEQSRLFSFMQKLGFDNWDDFYQYSIDDVGNFWDAVQKDMEIVWHENYQQVLDLNQGKAFPHWFVGGKINITINCLDRYVDDPKMRNQLALIWEGEDGKTIKYSYRDLLYEVNRFAKLLLQLGVGSSDRVLIYLPMIAENVIALLAIARIGAIAVPCFSGYKSVALQYRIKDCEAKVVITADGFWRRGKLIHMKDEVDKAIEHTTIEKVVVIKKLGCFIETNEARDVLWDTPVDQLPPAVPFITQADDPFMILYTSGNTSKPKGTVHTHAGFPIKSGFDAGYGMDVGTGDILFWSTDMGWMMGPWMVFGALMNGSTMLLYEGTPDYPTADQLWSIVEKHGVTHLGISPTIIRRLMKHGQSWLTTHDISSLRVFGSTGEPWTEDSWYWLFEQVGKKQVPIFNYAGGTEVSGGILSNVLIKPHVPCGFNSVLPGMDADIVDPSGASITQTIGELVIRQPWVGMTKGIWNNKARYLQGYWGKWKDVWEHGDWVSKVDGHWFTHGRSDDTIKIGGARLGPAELESILMRHHAVLEACAIGVPHKEKGESVICFVILHHISEIEDTSGIESELMNFVADKMGKVFRPKRVYIVPDLPKTKNGKILRSVVKASYLGEQLEDYATLEKSKAVEAIKQCRKS